MGNAAASSPDPIEFDRAEMMGWIAHQVAMGPRRPGSPAGQQNEAFLQDQLTAFGLSAVRKEPIPVVHWHATESSLIVEPEDEGQSLPCAPIPYTTFTTPAGLRAPLTYVHPKSISLPGRVRGTIVVTEIGFPYLSSAALLKIAAGVHDPGQTLADAGHPATWVRLGWHIYQLAVKKGAVGFIGILSDQPGDTCQMYAPYGFREADILDKKIPGLWVSRSTGEVLRRIAERSRARAHLTLSGQREPATTHNVVGEIRGQSRETVVLSCHHDSPYDSPVEDASGVAVVLALAKHFARRDPLRRTLVVLFSAGHFYGSIGTRTFIQQHRRDVVPNTVLEISIEHIAREAREDESGRLVPSGQPEATGIFVPFNRAVTELVLAAVRAHDLDRIVLLPPEGPLGDYPPTDGGDWHAAGIPVLNHICNPVYLLTADDAMDWVAADRLPKVAATFAEIIAAVDRMPAARVTRVDTRGRRLLMRLLRHAARARTTFFGLRPVH